MSKKENLILKAKPFGQCSESLVVVDAFRSPNNDQFHIASIEAVQCFKNQIMSLEELKERDHAKSRFMALDVQRLADRLAFVLILLGQRDAVVNHFDF